MNYFSAFSGIGGFDLGIDRAASGAVNVGCSEVDKYAIKIYKHHYPSRVNYGDIKAIEAESLPDFDVFCGGFPCQDVSIAGKRKGLCGARSGLFFEIVRIIREKQPRLVFLENVKGLLSSNNGWDFARILVELEESGYDVEWQVLNSKDFGVPQNRERVFIIGHLRGDPWAPIFPIGEYAEKFDEGAKQTTINTLTGGGHSGGLHSLMTLIQVIGSDSEAMRVYSADGLAKTLSNGGGLGAKPGLYIQSHYPRCGDPKKGGTGILTSNEYSFCLDQIPHRVNGVRRLTPLECERLQGFPDGWTDCGVSDTQRYKCLGNAVTVNVIEAVARRLFGYNDREERKTKDVKGVRDFAPRMPASYYLMRRWCG